MPFRFSLASVLQLRKSIERRAEISLMSAQLEVARVRHRIDELTYEMAKACQEREKALRNSTPAIRLQAKQVEISAAIEAKQILIETLQTLKLQRDTQMNAYKAAHRGHQALTDLRAQQKNLYEQEELRRQQKQLDDIFASRWLRS
ncbi:MAG: flagellar FliJ family protein [Terracidiphilus sp.]